MEDTQERTKFASYNSLARKPLLMGVPVIMLVLGSALMLLTGVLGWLLIGAKGLVFPALILLFLFYLRIRSFSDSRASEEIIWEIRGLISRLRCRSSIVSYSSIDGSTIRSKKDVSEWIKNNTTKK